MVSFVLELVGVGVEAVYPFLFSSSSSSSSLLLKQHIPFFWVYYLRCVISTLGGGFVAQAARGCFSFELGGTILDEGINEDRQWHGTCCFFSRGKKTPKERGLDLLLDSQVVSAVGYVHTMPGTRRIVIPLTLSSFWLNVAGS